MSTHDTAPVLLRWYTVTRRFQRLIGKAPGGGSYPGGPYTITQFLGGTLCFAALSFTEGLWGSGQWLQDKPVAVVASLVLLFLLGRIKVTSRNPVEAVVGAAGAATSPRFGVHAGRRVTAGRPVRYTRGRINVHTAAAAVAPASAAAEVTPPPPLAEPRPALSGVQQLLAQIEERPR